METTQEEAAVLLALSLACLPPTSQRPCRADEYTGRDVGNASLSCPIQGPYFQALTRRLLLQFHLFTRVPTLVLNISEMIFLRRLPLIL